jgi:hypothetical protein
MNSKQFILLHVGAWVPLVSQQGSKRVTRTSPPDELAGPDTHEVGYESEETEAKVL